jgi:hypothetical protein
MYFRSVEIQIHLVDDLGLTCAVFLAEGKDLSYDLVFAPSLRHITQISIVYTYKSFLKSQDGSFLCNQST